MTDTLKTSRIFNLSNTEPFESLAKVRARRFAQGTQRTRLVAPAAPGTTEGTELASLLLRRIASEGARVSILRALGMIEDVEWDHVIAPLAAAIRAIGRDVREAGIFAAVGAFQLAVPAIAWERAANASLGNPTAYLPLAEEEELQLARLTLSCIESEIQRYKTSVAEDDREQSIALAVTLPVHLWIASEAARRVRDRRRRASLTSDVERVSAGLAFFAQFLHMEPAVEWHPSFTTTFDAERALRLAMGLSAVDRM